MSTVTAPKSSPRKRPVTRLGRYETTAGTQVREILSLPRDDGSALVIDCLNGTLKDARLLAVLAPDEPRENARILCDLYLADESRGLCRALIAADLSPTAPADPRRPFDLTALQEASLPDPRGRLYAMRIIAYNESPPELCWTRSADLRQADAVDIVTLRRVIASLEDYEPARAMTAAALAHRDGYELVSTCRLAAEFERVTSSPIVLNRGLREAVQCRVASGELSMSEIAIRCGRMKRDRRGTLSGETSWLARRIGVAPEGGETVPTPWVHSDTLALIAREGLGLSPYEVEL